MRWGLKLLINVDDYTEKLIGGISISEEENLSTVCDFSITTIGSGYNPNLFTNVPVQILYSDANVTDLPQFTGFIDIPEYDINNGTMKFRCTDRLNTYLLENDTALDSTVINLGPSYILNNGVWELSGSDCLISVTDSDMLRTNSSNQLNYIKMKMDSLPASINLNSTRTSLIISSYLAKETPDYTFTEDHIILDSAAIELASINDIKNKASVNFDYRIPVLKEAKFVYQWTAVNPCEALQYNNLRLPTAKMIEDAINGTGWNPTSLTIDPGWPMGDYLCNGNLVPWTYDQASTQFALASFVNVQFNKRFIQQHTKKYTVNIQATESVTQFGEATFETTGSSSYAFDSEPWLKNYSVGPFPALQDTNGDSNGIFAIYADGSTA